jgi:cell division transport system permease protein
MRAKVQRSGLPGSRLTTAITTTVGMTLTLIMVGTVAVLALLGRTWERQLRQEARIQVYFEVEGDTASLAWAQEALRTDPAITDARFLDPETASRELEQDLGESFVDFLGYVPLPPVYDLTVHHDHASTDSMAVLVKRLQGIPGVADVVWQEELLGSIEATLRRLYVPLGAVALLFLLVAVALINNTIRLTVFARRFTIKTMQLVGLLAFAVVMGLLAVFRAQAGNLGTTLVPQSVALLAGLLVVTGVGIGLISTTVAVNRYLRKRAEDLH